MAIAQTAPLDPRFPTPASPPGAPQWIEGYRILDCIAEGGMGRVFRALDTASGQCVAMKLPSAGTAAEIAGLLRESAALKRLQHPGVVQLLADGIWLGTPWLALELLRGGRTLLVQMQSAGLPSGRLPAAPPAGAAMPSHERPLAAAGRLNDAAAIVLQTAMILDHVHGRGLVHRDLKPANIYLRTVAGGARVTLLDFGLACRTNAARSFERSLSQCVGTMEYAAPEQIRGEPVDARADVYSLGCILYELMTGRRPFTGQSDHEIAQKHLHREAPPPSRLVWGLPWQLDDLVMDMLAKRPAARPASAGAAAARLAAGLRREG